MPSHSNRYSQILQPRTYNHSQLSHKVNIKTYIDSYIRPFGLAANKIKAAEWANQVHSFNINNKIAPSMSLNRSERFIYFQNKAKHYNNLRHIKPAVDHSPPAAHIPKPKVYRPLPLLKHHQIQLQNQHLIDRLISIASSPRSQLETSGDYSRYNRVERPFRQINPLKDETQRVISIDNSDLSSRISKAKPAIGSKQLWSKDYSQSLCCRRNLSRYLTTNQSKAQITIATDKFVPQVLRDYGLSDNLDSGMEGRAVSVPLEKLFELPRLDRKRIEFEFEGDSGYTSLR